VVLLIEGGEGIRSVDELDGWWQAGIRIIGPAWTGTRFCGGTGEPGGLTEEGRELLDHMTDRGYILDLSHMAELAVMQALDSYPGQIIASHSNIETLVQEHEGGRHLTDQMLRGIIARNGVVGVVPYNKFLKRGWRKGDPRELVPLKLVAEQIDHICQVAGGTAHAGIGTDFDGGFGLQSVPPEIDSIADLQKLSFLLETKGYQESDIAAILGKNWVRILESSLPDEV
jgi:membrane dipeptidase